MKKSKLDKELLDAMSQDSNNWKGPVYFNKKDPRLIVPKLSGLGTTFNFANPFSYIALILIVVFAFLVAKLSKK